MKELWSVIRSSESDPSWWRHQMETFSALLAICAGNSPVPVISPHIGQWRGALLFSLISAWISGWVNNREAGDLRRNHAHYDVILMMFCAPYSYVVCNIVLCCITIYRESTLLQKLIIFAFWVRIAIYQYVNSGIIIPVPGRMRN